MDTTCLSNTVFFKHKYITQPTVTPADANVKALNDLMLILEGLNKIKGEQNMNAITKLQHTFNSPKLPSLPVLPQNVQSPSVEFHDKVQPCTYNPTGDTPLVQNQTTQLTVKSTLM